MLTRDYINYYSASDTLAEILAMGNTIAFFDASDLSTIDLNNGNVSKLKSKKGIYFFEQTEAAKQPNYDNINKNIRFDTSSKVLSSPNMLGITNNINKITVIAACSYPSTNGWHLLLYISTGGGTTATRIAIDQGQLGSASSVQKQLLARRIDTDSTVTLNSGMVSTAKTIQSVSIDYTQNTGSIYIDGALKASTNNLFGSGAGNVSSTNSNYVLLGQNNTGNYPFSGNFLGMAIGFYTDKERSDIEKYFSKSYGIPLLG